MPAFLPLRRIEAQRGETGTGSTAKPRKPD
jgi:hypothetical protein